MRGGQLDTELDNRGTNAAKHWAIKALFQRSKERKRTAERRQVATNSVFAVYFAASVRTVYCLIDEGQFNRTKIRERLRVPLTEIRRYERELEGRMGEE